MSEVVGLEVRLRWGNWICKMTLTESVLNCVCVCVCVCVCAFKPQSRRAHLRLPAVILMVKAPQSAYLILKLFFKTRERRSVSILLYKTRKHVIHLKMEMHIKLNLLLGASRTTPWQQVCPWQQKRCLCSVKRPPSHKLILTWENKPQTSNFKELASQWAKCLPCSKKPSENGLAISAAMINWEIQIAGALCVRQNLTVCSLASPKVPIGWRGKPSTGAVLQAWVLY